jgi:hypothetical protein
MRVPVNLTNSLSQDFEALLIDFLFKQGHLKDPESVRSDRFLNRSLIPHIERLSSHFNRLEFKKGTSFSERSTAELETENYWSSSSNPKNRRLAYFLYFMPPNLYRMAAVWSELARYGYKWPFSDSFRALELGAGPAAGSSGVLAAENISPIGLPKEGNWALIERDQSMLRLGTAWLESYAGYNDFSHWIVKPFQRELNFEEPLLRPSSPQFQLILMSFFLNEIPATPSQKAERLYQLIDQNLEEEGLFILVEPALKSESRKILEFRRELLSLCQAKGFSKLKVLLPCLGEQACAALAQPEDWCHEKITWPRPPLVKRIDELCQLDHKTLGFSYLVLTKSERSHEELLPTLKGSESKNRYRLVGDSYKHGPDQEFFLCGQDGKRRARYKTKEKFKRGDVLKNVELRGAHESTRIVKGEKL